MIIRLIKATTGRLEYDARSQYKFHLIATWIWFLSLIVVPFLIHPHDAERWLTLLILEVSLYSNFSTEFGAMSSAIAAEQEQRPDRRIPRFTNPNYKLPGPDGRGWDAMDSAGYEEPPREAHF